MAGMNTGNSSVLIRSNVWSDMLKEILRDDLQAQKWMRMLPDFVGTTLNIPSIGQLTVRNYTEGNPVVYDPIDTGNYTFTIDQYISSATAITEKARTDLFYASELEAKFVPEQRRAIEEHIETKIFATASDSTRGGQTTADANSINGANHRWVGNGGASGSWTMEPEDFARAGFALQRANVPQSNLVAFVHPEVAYTLETATNIVNVSNNPRWEGVIETGLTDGMRFIRNVYGFDVYLSNYLDSAASETVGSDSTGAGGVCNVLFSAMPEVTPFMFSWRQQPTVDGGWNHNLRQEEYVTVCQYGVQIYRPENLVCVLTDTSTVGF